jgi:uncharacterized zinc-type alcohol dehydrogenase-like protein
MSQIQGLAAHAAGAELLAFKYDPGKLGVNEVEIAITHCGICHSDLHLIANDWGISQYPFIPGHEVIGTITAIGRRGAVARVGQRVGLGWQSNSCGVCEWCSRGMENLCPASEGPASTARRLCGQGAGQCALCDSHSRCAGERTGGAAALRRHHGL